MTVDIDATTPQLKLVKNLFEAYQTLDLNNVAKLLSKDYKFQTFPKISEHPDETPDGHVEKYGRLLSMFTKIEAGARYQGTALNLAH